MENAAMRILTGLLVLTLSMGAMAQLAPGHYQAGRHYEVLEKPVATSDPDKIEVVEIFSYLCGHCFTFAPLVSAWEERLADDVVLVHAHAVWSPAIGAHARGAPLRSFGKARRHQRPGQNRGGGNFLLPLRPLLYLRTSGERVGRAFGR